MAAASRIQIMLEKIGLGTLAKRFDDEKVEPEMIESLSDRDLTQLGIVTIGDRARLRDQVRQARQAEPANNNLTNAVQHSSVLRRTYKWRDFEAIGWMKDFIPDSHARTTRLSQEVGSLFGPTRSRLGNRGRRENILSRRQRTWTGKFFCIADNFKEKTPSSEEKMLLQKSGLGSKKIQFNISDSEEDVYKIICNTYLPLKNCGGYELLRCRSNCRTLQLIEGKYTVQNLKCILGSQCTVYIRPIQRRINLTSDEIDENEIKEQCSSCNKFFLLKNLREHVNECTEGINPTTHSQQSATISNSNLTEEESNQTIPSDSSSLTTDEPTRNIDSIQEELVNDIIDVINNDSINDIVKDTFKFSRQNNINNPVDILRYYQQAVVTGRKLEIEDELESIDSNDDEVNYIMIARSRCLETAIEEIKDLQNLRLCLEEAKDFGGPRKEFFTLVLQEIKEQYFTPVREWSEDYYTIGKIFALSTLQNGKLPRILSPELLTELFESESPRKFIADLRSGMDALGLYRLVRHLPIMIHLFTPQTTPLTYKKLADIIKPKFSVEGSNQRTFEDETYQQFNKYVREVAAGRRHGVTLNHILKFVTGADEEPILGFTLQPSLHFTQSGSFIPTSSTCANRLYLTVSTMDRHLPRNEELFNLFDYAFMNSYFGYE